MLNYRTGFFILLLIIEDGICKDSLYFATVLLAISMPSALIISTILSSDNIFFGLSSSMSSLILYFIDLEEYWLSLFNDDIALVKKYFISNIPLGVEIYLLVVTRLTVLSCISMASAMVLRLIGTKYWTPSSKNFFCIHLNVC